MSSIRKSNIRRSSDDIDKMSIDDMRSRIQQGNLAALSRAITWVESEDELLKSKGRELLAGIQPENQSVRIGITGVPGVGKSTFIESFGNYLIDTFGKKVAVLAIDPTSQRSGGSILGDKTRMEKLASRKEAFIRPSASGSTLGGVQQHTREAIALCEWAGYDVIIVETVGVGQSETAVRDLVDFFLLLMLAGAGDELQGIKRGIMEMADVLVINKADGENKKMASKAKAEYQSALHLFPATDSTWIPEVKLCSGLNGEGIEEVWQSILRYEDLTKAKGYWIGNRREQDVKWLREAWIQEQIRKLTRGSDQGQRLENALEKVELQGGNAFYELHRLIDQ